MLKLFINSIFIFLLLNSNSFANSEFNDWVEKFKIRAIQTGISEEVVVEIMSNAKFLPKVIEYDRYQPSL